MHRDILFAALDYIKGLHAPKVSDDTLLIGRLSRLRADLYDLSVLNSFISFPFKSLIFLSKPTVITNLTGMLKKNFVL